VFTPVILTIPTLILPLLLPSPPAECQFGRLGNPVADARAVTAFEARVDEYVALHRRLARSWPPAWITADLEFREFAAEAFRKVLRDARPQAVQGGLFTPDVADILRFRIANAVRERNYDTAAITSFNSEGGSEGWRRPVVNEEFAWDFSGTTWPLFDVLPFLPLELEYRLVGRDLVLLDMHSNIVVDVLELALPASLSPERELARPAPAQGETPLPSEDDERPSPVEEQSGCWYGEVEDLTKVDDTEDPESY
jgi:hypothetical protein